MKTINYKNIEWIVLEENEDYKKLITKNILPKEIMEDLTGNNSSYCAFDNVNNNYETSTIRMIIQNFVVRYLNESDLIKQDNGDYARLIKAEEVIGYDNELTQCNDWYWTMTPFFSKDMSRAWRVNRNGNLNYDPVSNDTYDGVRPVIYLKSNISISKKMTVKEICDELGYEVEIVKE